MVTLTVFIWTLKDQNLVQLMKWISFAENYPVDSKACFRILNGLNGDLIQKSVIVGGGTEPSEADVIVFSAVHSSVVCILHILLQLFVTLSVLKLMHC